MDLYTHSNINVMFSFCCSTKSTCVTKKLLHWWSTMDPVCARLVSPVTMPPVPFSRRSSAVPVIRE